MIKRLASLDLIRCVAILCVLLVHVTELVYNFDSDMIGEYGAVQSLFAISCFTIGRLGVPLFFFLTGYLILGRNYEGEGIIRFYKEKLWPLLLTIEVWIILYNIYLCVLEKNVFSIKSCIRQMIFIDTTNLPHCWYIPAIVGIYLFIPFISAALNQISTKVTVCVVICVVLYIHVIDLINSVTNIFGYDSMSSDIYLSFSGGMYGTYCVIGYLFSKVKEKNMLLLNSICMTSFVIAVLVQYESYLHGAQYKIWYSNVLLMVCAGSWFIMHMNSERISCEKPIALVSRYSFGIFLMHIIVLRIIRHFWYLGNNILDVVILYACTFIICTVVIACVEKNRIIAKVLFNMK